MISMRVNHAEFQQELERELEAAGGKAVLEMTKRVARHIRNRAEENSPSGQAPRRGVPLKESWGVSVGRLEVRHTKRRTDADAAATLQNLQLGEEVWVSSSDFTSSFFENGTAKMAPRPIVQPAIEETRSFVG